MDLGIENRNALVLASSQGLGLGIAKKLCEEGVNVLLSGRSEDKLAAAAEELTANGNGPGKAHYTVVDLFNADAAHQLYRAAQHNPGGVDILVNNTGGPPPGTVDSPDSEQWHAQIDAMLIRIIEITNLCIVDMKKSGWGRVLTLASSGVVQPIPNLSMSNTIRSSLVGWSKSLSNEVAGAGITVNMLLPGRIHTERVDQIDAANAKKLGKTVEEVAAETQASIPMGRYGTVEEFASVGAFLVSEAARYVTGSLIRCDGGLIRSV
jgi:3-oxoacyl-[acyl-carrier protein] reductase